MNPILVVFSGLPGTGKTTLAKALVASTGWVYLRIDAIEQAILRRRNLAKIGATGYDVANELALSNLRLGNSVVVDGVNPVAESREAWRRVASAVEAQLIDVQLVCSDAAEHRRRVETRTADVPGLTLPDWSSVQSHEFEPWAGVPFTLDTAALCVEEALEMLMARLALGA